LEKPRRHPPPQEKTTLPLGTRVPPSNRLIPRPTTLTTPNGIQIQSAVLPQYTPQTDRQTDRHMGLATGDTKSRLR